MSLISILCDGGPHGLGHLRRASELGWSLKESGFSVRVEALSGDGRRLLPPSPGDAGSADAVVLDLPHDADRHLAGRTLPTLALDYFGRETPDLTISVMERQDPPPAGKRRQGLEFAIVRRDVRALRPAPAGKGVLVLIGGGDARGRGRAAAERAASFGEPVSLIEGPLTPERPAPKGTELFRSPADLPLKMAACRWAVCNGGVTMTELMHLGKALWISPQTPEEERLARSVLALGGLFGVGDAPDRAPTEAEAAKIGKRAAEIIDGKGADRIAAALKELLA